MLKEREKRESLKLTSIKRGMKRFKNKVKKLVGYNSGFALYDKDGFIRP